MSTSAVALHVQEANTEEPPRGVVIRLRLVAPGVGRASGTFSAVGAVSGQGTASTDWVVPPAPSEDMGAAPVLVEGDVRMRSPAGQLVAAIGASAHLVPATGVLTGGGTWTLAEATGVYDGLRASGSVTLVAAYESVGTAILDLVLVGRIPTRSRAL